MARHDWGLNVSPLPRRIRAMALIPIFRPGRHAPHLTVGELQRTVEAYDPDQHRAPLVFGHPKHDAPAHGWVESLEFAEDLLSAEATKVSGELRTAVNDGRFGPVSAAFYRPTSPHNPTPGVYALRHVGFLGGQPPVVKGLPAVSFAEGDSETDCLVVEFAETSPWAWRSVARLLRGMREWIIDEKDQETADRVLPSWEVDQINEEAERLENERADSARFSEPGADPNPDGGSSDMKTEQELAAEAAQLEADRTALAQEREALQASQAAAAKREALAFAEDLCGQGRLLPKHKDAVVELLTALPADTKVQFAEGDGAPLETPAGDWLRGFLKELPVQVDFAERAPGAADPQRGGRASSTDMGVPLGFAVGASADLHRKALEFSEAHNVDYETALLRVS